MSKNMIISIHPIVILNISEFYNRMRVNFNSKRVFGGLIGEQKNNKIELFSSFEFFNNDETCGKADIDTEFLEQRKNIAMELYSNYEFIGFFSTNTVTQADELDRQVHSTLISQGCVSPINVVLCTYLQDKETLPIKAFFFDKETQKFEPLLIEILSYESERICLDTVTKQGGIQMNDSQLVQNSDTLNNALGMLKGNLTSLLEKVKDPKNRSDPKFMRLVDEIIKNYPSPSNVNDLSKYLDKNMNEMLIISNITSTSLGISYSKS